MHKVDVSLLNLFVNMSSLRLLTMDASRMSFVWDAPAADVTSDMSFFDWIPCPHLDGSPDHVYTVPRLYITYFSIFLHVRVYPTSACVCVFR